MQGANDCGVLQKVLLVQSMTLGEDQVIDAYVSNLEHTKLTITNVFSIYIAMTLHITSSTRIHPKTKQIT